ncbi:MAG: PAS domain-containing sensor histidine kinase [Firmicutes bacterium]|nr:PAS domain-containing sensor histidine kinase [Bacillota bacterium]
MNSKNLTTYFAPAERALDKHIAQQAKATEDLFGDCSFLDALPNIVMVLNHNRQVILCNRVLLDLLGVEDHESVKGLRPGELLRCVHACEMPGGCGTTEFCRTCGAVNAIMESQYGRKVYHECRILINNNGRTKALDLGVTAMPIRINNEEFTVLSMADISDEKRRHSLERIFFHDVMNTAGVLTGVAELLENTADADLAKEFILDIQSSAKLLVEQIREQRDLTLAENNELKVSTSPLQSLNILSNVAAHFANHETSLQQQILIDPTAENIVFTSNPQLLHRVLGNMLKNALEASEAGDTVWLGCRFQDGQVEYWVNNPGVMPREIQLQLFQRSFSTKGKDRGLGTYSMKLLTERYLQGSISFTVSKKEGTTFFARYPRHIQATGY